MGEGDLRVERKRKEFNDSKTAGLVTSKNSYSACLKISEFQGVQIHFPLGVIGIVKLARAEVLPKI